MISMTVSNKYFFSCAATLYFNIAYNAFEKDIAILNLYFGKDTVPEYETNERMTVWDFISNIGGLLGLCAGVSILSCAEIIYWFILRMFSN